MALKGRTAGGALAAAAAVAVLLAAAGPAAAADAAEEAERAYAEERFEVARAIWAGLAAAGDPEAQYRLGLLFDLGRGVPEDAAEALRRYLAAAEAGLPAAAFNVAVMLDSGRGAPRDRSGAAVWYARAAARGHGRAGFNLAQLYEAGDGVPGNPDLAEAWYRASGVPAAARRIEALRAARAAARAGDGGGDGALLAPAALSPKDGERLAPGDSGPGGVALVWTVPGQPAAAAVRYFVQVVALDPGGTREVFAVYADTSATLAPPLGGAAGAPGRYAWRVYAVDAERGRYAPGDWARFEAGGTPG